MRRQRGARNGGKSEAASRPSCCGRRLVADGAAEGAACRFSAEPLAARVLAGCGRRRRASISTRGRTRRGWRARRAARRRSAALARRRAARRRRGGAGARARRTASPGSPRRLATRRSCRSISSRGCRRTRAAPAAVAVSASGLEPMFALWPVAALGAVEAALAAGRASPRTRAGGARGGARALSADDGLDLRQSQHAARIRRRRGGGARAVLEAAEPAPAGSSFGRDRVSKVAFLGLGVMGFPMAGHLAGRGGHDVVVYNRTAAKAKAWVAKHGGAAAPTPREAAQRPRRRARLRRQRRRSALGHAGRRRRLRRHEAGRDLRRSHHRLRQRRARTRRGGDAARPRLRRRAGVGRPGGRGERPAHHHVRRRARRLRRRSSRSSPTYAEILPPHGRGRARAS